MADYVENFGTGGNITSDWWPAGSSVKLCRVNWDSTYRDVVIFDSKEERNDWFDSLGSYFSWTIENMSYLKPRQAIKVNLPYSDAFRYNYCMVRNPASPKYDDTRMFYFVTNVEYVAPSTTLITLQLDVIMTYQHLVNIGSCFVERGHVAQANANYRTNMAGVGKSWAMRRYLDVPEGLDVGSDYVTVDTECISISDDGYYIIIMSTADLTADPGTINNPNLKTAGSGNVSGIPSSCEVYAMDIDNWVGFLRDMQSYPWVTQCIICAYSFPKRFVIATGTVHIGNRTAYSITSTASATVYPADESATLARIDNIFERIHSKIDATVKHDKFCVFPYSFIEITANTGTSVLLKPQYMPNALTLKTICCALYPFARIGVIPWEYGGRTTDNYTVSWTDLQGQGHMSLLNKNEGLANALWLADFPMFSIVNNSYMSYMASTAHSRTYSYEAAGWTLARTNMASQLSYEQAQGAMATNQMNRDLSNEMARLNMGVSFGTGLIGAGGQLLSGNFGGAAASAANTVMNAAMSQAQYANSNQQFANSMSQAQFVAGSNFDLARQAAAGDYEMAIKSINSAVQDAALMAPSVVGQSGGDVLAQANGLYNITINFKMITAGVQARIADFWSRYGYQVNEFIQGSYRPMKSLKVMSRFSYWKMRECYLQNSNATNDELLTIKGILERGTTVWNSPNLIGSPVIDSNEVDETKADWSY